MHPLFSYASGFFAFAGRVSAVLCVRRKDTIMKTAEISAKTIIGANGSYIINEKTGTVMIRMADFYPGYNGENEYEEISKELFEEFYADKSSVKNQPETVILDFHTLFPCVKKIPRGMETIELAKDLYEQIMEYRKTSDEVIIRAQEFYPEKNYVGDEYLIIKKDLYEFLLEDSRRHHREEYFDYTWRAAFNIEEMTPAQIADYTTSSAEDVCLENISSERIYSAIKQLDPVLAGRVYKMFYLGMTKIQIAVGEGVTKSAVSQSIKSALEQLRKILAPTDEKETFNEICCENDQNECTEFVELYEILKMS